MNQSASKLELLLETGIFNLHVRRHKSTGVYICFIELDSYRDQIDLVLQENAIDKIKQLLKTSIEYVFPLLISVDERSLLEVVNLYHSFIETIYKDMTITEMLENAIKVNDIITGMAINTDEDYIKSLINELPRRVPVKKEVEDKGKEDKEVTPDTPKPNS